MAKLPNTLIIAATDLWSFNKAIASTVGVAETLGPILTNKMREKTEALGALLIAYEKENHETIEEAAIGSGSIQAEAGIPNA